VYNLDRVDRKVYQNSVVYLVQGLGFFLVRLNSSFISYSPAENPLVDADLIEPHILHYLCIMYSSVLVVHFEHCVATFTQTRMKK